MISKKEIENYSRPRMDSNYSTRKMMSSVKKNKRKLIEIYYNLTFNFFQKTRFLSKFVSQGNINMSSINVRPGYYQDIMFSSN